jgi:predicted DNA-binding ArsR family transcriptional regulator
MAAFVPRLACTISRLTPLGHLRTRLHPNFTAFRKFSITAMISPKISEGQNDAEMKADLESLIENGWKLNEDQIQLEKTYHFKTYTKVAVSSAGNIHHVSKKLIS